MNRQQLNKNNVAKKKQVLKQYRSLVKSKKFSIDAAAVELGYSRQRIYQMAQEVGEPMGIRKPTLFKDVTCAVCSKVFTVTDNKYHQRTQFCSRFCYRKSSEACGRTIEEKRAAWAKKANKYYHKVLKKRPDFKALVKERNHRAWIAKNQK